MAKQEKELKVWHKRLKDADDAYKDWYDLYGVESLEKYYLGQQEPEGEGDHFVLNLFFSTVETKKPSLLYFTPKPMVEPKEARLDDPGSSVIERAKLREDVLHTLLSDKQFNFRSRTQLAMHESFFSYGIVEVGYSAEWVDNPQARKPVLEEEGDKKLYEEGAPRVKPEEEPDMLMVDESEKIYVKRIPAAQFRVPKFSKNELEENDWVGYFEWHHIDDIRKNRAYKNTNRSDLRTSSSTDDNEDRAGMVKLWKIWDLRAAERLIFVEGSKKFLQRKKLTKRKDGSMLPFADLKFHEILDSWYPLPPTYNWLKLQDQINEAFEMRRIHRKRALRRYTYDPNKIEEDALDRLEEGGDMTFVPELQSDGTSPLRPIPDAPLDFAVFQDLNDLKDGFIEASGVPSDYRGLAQSETATQANILDIRSRMRENSPQQLVSEWVSSILCLVLSQMEENLSLSFWVKRAVDPTAEGAIEEQLKVAALWEQITGADLGELTYDVSVNLEELSPVGESQKREAWNQVLQIMTNESLLALLMQSDVLLRKTLAFYGIRSDKEVLEIQRVGSKFVEFLGQMRAEEAGGPGAAGPEVAPQQAGAGGEGSPEPDIAAQLAAQVGMLPQ